jgi:hypothetical protein
LPSATEEFKQQTKDFDQGKKGAYLGKKWSEQDPAEKRQWTLKAKEMREEFFRRHPDYKYTTGRKKPLVPKPKAVPKPKCQVQVPDGQVLVRTYQRQDKGFSFPCAPPASGANVVSRTVSETGVGPFLTTAVGTVPQTSVEPYTMSVIPYGNALLEPPDPDALDPKKVIYKTLTNDKEMNFQKCDDSQVAKFELVFQENQCLGYYDFSTINPGAAEPFFLQSYS